MKKKLVKKSLSFILSIAISISLMNGLCFAQSSSDNEIKSYGVISNISYNLQSGVKEIDLSDAGFSTSIITSIKNKTQKQFTTSVNERLQKNAIYLDKQENISIKVISVASGYNGYEVKFEMASLSEVFSYYDIPKQTIDIVQNNIVESSIPDNVDYMAKESEGLEDGDVHTFEFDDYQVPESDIKINGTVTLDTPKILTELAWNKNFKVALTTGQQVDINISGTWNFESSSKKLLLSNIEVPADDGVGKLYAGLYVNMNASGGMALSVDIDQALNYSSSIEGDFKTGVDPINIKTNYDIDKKVNSQVQYEEGTNSFFPIELYAGLDILGQEIKIVCIMGIEVTNTKTKFSLYVDIDGRCIGTATIFEETVNVFDDRWDINEYTLPLSDEDPEPTEINFSASKTNIAKYDTVILSWSTTNVATVKLSSTRSQLERNLGTSGTMMVSPNKTETYTLKVTDEYGNETTQTITIYVGS